jgi:hypothetical protein
VAHGVDAVQQGRGIHVGTGRPSLSAARSPVRCAARPIRAGHTAGAPGPGSGVHERGIVHRAPKSGAWTPYSSQIVRLVNPIFHPTGRSPRCMRRRMTSADTAYAS